MSWGVATFLFVGHLWHAGRARVAIAGNERVGWRNFLWSESSQIIQSYGSQGGSYGLLFLGAHFVWAFSLMFLFSGRGYWQELIDSLCEGRDLRWMGQQIVKQLQVCDQWQRRTC